MVVGREEEQTASGYPGIGATLVPATTASSSPLYLPQRQRCVVGRQGRRLRSRRHRAAVSRAAALPRRLGHSDFARKPKLRASGATRRVGEGGRRRAGSQESRQQRLAVAPHGGAPRRQHIPPRPAPQILTLSSFTTSRAALRSSNVLSMTDPDPSAPCTTPCSRDARAAPWAAGRGGRAHGGGHRRAPQRRRRPARPGLCLRQAGPHFVPPCPP